MLIVGHVFWMYLLASTKALTWEGDFKNRFEGTWSFKSFDDVKSKFLYSVLNYLLFSAYVLLVKGARQLNAGFVKGIHGSAIKKDSVIKHSKTEQHLRALKMFPELVEGYQAS